jgi:hypothetical protein
MPLADSTPWGVSTPAVIPPFTVLELFGTANFPERVSR